MEERTWACYVTDEMSASFRSTLAATLWYVDISLANSWQSRWPRTLASMERQMEWQPMRTRAEHDLTNGQRGGTGKGDNQLRVMARTKVPNAFACLIVSLERSHASQKKPVLGFFSLF